MTIYFSQSFLSSNGMDYHPVPDASHHGQQVKANTHSHSGGQVDHDDILFLVFT